MSGRLAGLALAALCAYAVAGERSCDESPFRFATPVTPAGAVPDRGELGAVTLPPEAYAAVRGDLADLRVVRQGGGGAVPCLVTVAREERHQTVRHPVRLRLTRADELPDGRLRLTLEREDADRMDRPLAGLCIQTPLKDFERRVTAELSADGARWLPGASGVRVLDLSSRADFRACEVALSSVPGARFLRLTIEGSDEWQEASPRSVTTTADGAGTVQAVQRTVHEAARRFRVDRVDGWTEESEWVRDASRLVDRQVRVSAEVPAELQKRFPEARLIRFEAARVPLERILTRTAKPVVSLAYQLFEKRDAPGAGEAAWQPIASGKVSRIVFRDIREERLEIAFAEARASAFCLVLPDREGASDLELVCGRGPSHQVVFPLAAGEAYTLLAGCPELEGPAGYQSDQIRVLLRAYRPVELKLEGWRENPMWRRPERSAAGAAWVLPAAVVLAVAALAAAVAFALRRMPESVS